MIINVVKESHLSPLPLVHAWTTRSPERHTKGAAKLQSREPCLKALEEVCLPEAGKSAIGRPSKASKFSLPGPIYHHHKVQRPARRCRVSGRRGARRESLWRHAKKRALSPAPPPPAGRGGGGGARTPGRGGQAVPAGRAPPTALLRVSQERPSSPDVGHRPSRLASRPVGRPRKSALGTRR